MLQLHSERRRILAGCFGAVLGGAITLGFLLGGQGVAGRELFVAITVSGSLGAILCAAASDPDRAQPSRFSLLANVVAAIPVSLLLIFPVVALYALLFELPIPFADVKPSLWRRVMGSPFVLLFFGAAQKEAARFWLAVACVGIAASCVAFMVNRRRAFSLMLVTTAHALFLIWLLYWAHQLPA